jgi:thioredoxin 2
MVSTLAVCEQCGTVNRVVPNHASSRIPVVIPICGRCKAELPIHNGIQDLSERTFPILVKRSPALLIVYFWAPWCAPCKAFAPIYEQAAQEASSFALFAKLNTETYPNSGSLYGIRGIPTLILFQHGKELDRRTGALPLVQLVDYIKHWYIKHWAQRTNAA